MLSSIGAQRLSEMISLDGLNYADEFTRFSEANSNEPARLVRRFWVLSGGRNTSMRGASL